MSCNRGPRIVTDSLILYLDAANTSSYSGSGTSWNDLSGAGNNGTLTNGPTFNSGNKGAISFDGSDDYVDISSSAIFTGTSNVTMDIWFYETASNSNTVVFYNGNTASNGFGFFIGSGNTLNVIYGGITGTVFTPSVTLSSGTWYNFTFVAGSSSDAFLYKNGILQGSTIPISFNTPSGPATIAGISSGYYFYGKIPIARLYSKALTATEILSNYNATKSRFGL